MKPKLILTLAAGLFALAACQPKEAETSTTEPETSAPEPAAEPEASAEEIAAAKPYPLNVCIVSDEELGSMGEPPVLVYEGQLIKFCCKHCIPDFEKDPQAYLSKLKDTAPAAQP